MAAKEIKVVLKKGGADKRHKKVLTGLGLRKKDSSKVLQDTPAIRGMINKVSHLVCVEEVK